MVQTSTAPRRKVAEILSYAEPLAGFIPAIHVFVSIFKNVGARLKAGHGESNLLWGVALRERGVSPAKFPSTLPWPDPRSRRSPYRRARQCRPAACGG